ncbi:MAG: hypothetical protein A2X59_02480 [Nitrospirae bacterium GWC2_42_7]|nr:MAG: hypothetical protein A2X59_02480 [Nitrospirae bacterium GWC2_42_7]
MQVDLSTNNVTAIFSENVSIYTKGMLEISPDRNYLFFANVGLSPGTLAKYDVSTDTPSLLIRNPHGSLGSNGQDLAISQDGNHIYYAVGGGNWITNAYDIGQLSTTTFGPFGALVTGAYPREITTSPDGKTAYAVHTSGHIDVWDAQTYLKLKEYPTTGEAYELITDHSGNYLLAAFSNQLRVYAAEGSEPRVDSDADGIDNATDNCVNDFNPNQEDADNDWIGDICDPFPFEANHPFAQCSAELDKLMELREDTDNDGEIDRNDKCPNTQLGLEVDDSGCSLNEFCNNYSGKTKKLCESADWKNDKPLTNKPKDCMLGEGSRGDSSTCVAAY